jgi:syntaxin-binding protein 1
LLAKRIRTIKEINIDFHVSDQNFFHYNAKDALYLHNMDHENSQFLNYIAILADKIISTLSVLNEKPYIQYHSESLIAKILAEEVQNRLEIFYEFNKTNPREPRGTMIILDRTFDLFSPIMHDYAYESAV